MGDEEQATLDGQYFEFCKLFDNKRSGVTITLYRSDFWMRQARILDDRKVTMSDTGMLFYKYSVRVCYIQLLHFNSVECYLYCNTTFDGFLCWPPAQAGTVVTQNCPPGRLSDTTSQAFRTCSDDGLWVGRRPNETSSLGWTNYTPCFPTEVQQLLSLVYDTDDKKTQSKFDTANSTRYMEIIGFSVSLIAICLSLIIYTQYRCLRNTRTRVHCSLFSAMLLQVIIRLILYGDQALVRSTQEGADNSVVQGIDNMRYVCESSYICLEYAISVMFMWMFIEGMYLHQLVATNSLRGEIPFKYYYLIGWGLPLIITIIWATLNAIHYSQRKTHVECWYGYNFHALYWILQGPRLGVILINFLSLLNILRVLIVKLNHSTTSELVRVRKAVRAAFVLLPLLGITNVLSMFEYYASTHGVALFQIWSYITHLLRSFQGFFIAVIYCFANEENKTSDEEMLIPPSLDEPNIPQPDTGDAPETASASAHVVKQAVKKHYQNYKTMRMHGRRDRPQGYDEFMLPQQLRDNEPGCSGENRPSVPLQDLRHNQNRPPVANRSSQTEFGAEISTDYRSPSPDDIVFEELRIGYDRRRDPERIFELVTI